MFKSKKIVIGALSLVVALGGVAGMAAFEAHIINVTAHIENGLAVQTDPIDFGTVFPQESFVSKPFTVGLSSSFLAQDRQDEVQYKIEQKVKCQVNDSNPAVYVPCVGATVATCVCPAGSTALPSLCRFLSKTPTDGDSASDTIDTGVPSYFIPANGAPAHCAAPASETALGQLDNSDGDSIDNWTVDLKVPPITGAVGQDWPATCADYTVPTDGATYGCDLWVEVTGITNHDENPTGSITVIKHVVGDEPGGGLDSDDIAATGFNVHLKLGAVEVGTSPDAGSEAGTLYGGLAAGAYTVSEDAVTTDDTITTTYSGACNGTPTINLTAGQNATCTITNTFAEPIS